MRPGNILFLNGTSSSGKTTIAKALQDSLEVPYLHTGIDHFIERYPGRMLVYSDGVNPPDAEGWLVVFRNDTFVQVQIGPAGYRLIAGMYRAIAALAASGINLIVDDIIYNQRVLKEAVNVLQPFQVWFVGIRCPLEVAERREQERGDRAKGGAKVFYDRVHAHGIYDIEIDSATYSAEECAQQIRHGMQQKSSPNAFNRLRSMLSNDQA
jgi:chloramphenicol 3-O phosphotransferase